MRAWLKFMEDYRQLGAASQGLNPESSLVAVAGGLFGDLVDLGLAAAAAPGSQPSGCGQGRLQAAPTLDHGGLNGTFGDWDDADKLAAEFVRREGVVVEDRVEVYGCRCRSWGCPDCASAFWSKFYRKIEPHLRDFARPKMLTMTVDPSKFASGEEAYRHVQGQGLIRRFLRLMGFKTGFAWMEFHKDKESRPDARNWPHWHVVVDLADLRGGWVDLKRGWRLWRDKWGVGMWKCGGDDRGARHVSAYQAGRYALRYAKRKNPVADWVLNREVSPRAFNLYGRLRDRVGEYARSEREHQESKLHDASGSTIADVVDLAVVQFAGHNSKLLDRVARCGRGSEVIRVRVLADGTRKVDYLGKLHVATPRFLRRSSSLGLLPGGEEKWLEWKHFGWTARAKVFTVDLSAWSCVEDLWRDLQSHDASALLSGAADDAWLDEHCGPEDDGDDGLAWAEDALVPEYVFASDLAAPF